MRFYCCLFACLLFNQIAIGCSCSSSSPIDEKQYNDYDFIAKGEIVKVEENRFKKTIYFRVSTYYKGERNDTVVTIESRSHERACGISPKVGESWLVFAYASGQLYKTHLCTRTKNMNPTEWGYNKEELEKDIAFLEARRKKLKDKSSTGLPSPATLQKKNSQW